MVKWFPRYSMFTILVWTIIKRLQWKWAHKDTEQSRFWPNTKSRDTPVVYNTITAFLLSYFIIIQKLLKTVKPFSRYSTLKNRAIWLDEPFLAIFGQIRIFPKNLIRPLFTPYTPVPSCKKLEKSLEPILVNIRKSQFLGHFWPFLAVFGQIRIFPKNRAPLGFSIYGPLTSFKTSLTNQWTLTIFLKMKRTRKTDRLIDLTYYWQTGWPANEAC